MHSVFIRSCSNNIGCLFLFLVTMIHEIKYIDDTYSESNVFSYAYETCTHIFNGGLYLYFRNLLS